MCVCVCSFVRSFVLERWGKEECPNDCFGSVKVEMPIRHSMSGQLDM